MESVRFIFRGRKKEMAMPATIRLPAHRDPTGLDPRRYKVEFENERVRILRINYKRGEKSQENGRPALMGIFLSDSSIQFTYPDGKTDDICAKAGNVLYFDDFKRGLNRSRADRLEVLAIGLRS
jgi:hypothetical protein